MKHTILLSKFVEVRLKESQTSSFMSHGIVYKTNEISFNSSAALFAIRLADGYFHFLVSRFDILSSEDEKLINDIIFFQQTIQNINRELK
mgnify:CR=1 FL=1